MEEVRTDASTGRRVGVLLAVVALAGCEVADQPAAPLPSARAVTAAEPGPLDMDFDDVVAEYGTIIARVGNGGTAPMRTSVATSNGGRVRLARGEPGAAARFPDFTGADDAPAAALLVRPSGAKDALEPRRRDFAFGARFWLDPEHGGAGNDDGNNLMQRGLFEDDSQYKIQVDRGVPSCRIVGDDGEAMVELEEPVATEQWLGIECHRRGDQVDLILTDVAGTTLDAAAVEQATGSVTFESGTVLAVGAKVGAGGTIPVRSTDQFNGAIDGVFYRRLP